MEGQIPGSTWMSRQVLPAAAGSGWLGEGGWKFWRAKVPLLMCFCWAIARGPYAFRLTSLFLDVPFVIFQIMAVVV